MTVSGNLPKWPGAAKLYSRAYATLEEMGRSGHAKPALVRQGKVVQQGIVSIEMDTLIKALDSGNEEQIKGLLLQTHIYPYKSEAAQ